MAHETRVLWMWCGAIILVIFDLQLHNIQSQNIFNVNIYVLKDTCHELLTSLFSVLIIEFITRHTEPEWYLYTPKNIFASCSGYLKSAFCHNFIFLNPPNILNTEVYYINHVVLAWTSLTLVMTKMTSRGQCHDRTKFNCV